LKNDTNNLERRQGMDIIREAELLESALNNCDDVYLAILLGDLAAKELKDLSAEYRKDPALGVPDRGLCKVALSELAGCTT
jgi:hypothetical protein